MSAFDKRVLLVEDNADNRLLTTILLEAEGFQVIPIASGAEAVRAVEETGIAFVLLDLQLPDLDGFEVARLIREQHAKQDLPIIAVSAFALPHDRRRAFAAGCNGYLEKPIDPDAFVAQVRCILGPETMV